MLRWGAVVASLRRVKGWRHWFVELKFPAEEQPSPDHVLPHEMAVVLTTRQHRLLTTTPWELFNARLASFSPNGGWQCTSIAVTLAIGVAVFWIGLSKLPDAGHGNSMMKETVNAISGWFVRIYSEDDFGRNVATSAAGVIALVAYLVFRDWVIAALAIVITFPITRLVATELHDRRTRHAEARSSKEDAKRLWDQLSSEEQQVVGAFVLAGGCVLTWGQLNKAAVAASAVESLIARRLLETSVMADGCAETFLLDPDLFDTGQVHWEPQI